MAVLADVVAALDARYDPAWAESWDSVGLVCGDPATEVSRVLVAIDPVEVVVDEAIASGVDLLVTHHPLFLGGTESVAATTAKGRVVHRLISNGMALYVAHTNADVATPGVNDALAEILLLEDIRPLDPSSAHGLGRIGTLPGPFRLDAFVNLVAATLPATNWGIRAGGNPARVVRTVAVCGGSGGGLAAAAAQAGADVLLTADLKHHSTSEALADLDIALVDAAHWATEQPWAVSAARLLVADLEASGIEVGGHRVNDLDRPLDAARPLSRGTVKAAPEDQARLLEVQALDAAIDRLAHRPITLPELEQIQTLHARQDELADDVVRAETEDSDLGREQARVDADVEIVRGRMDRDQKRLDDGQVGSPRELENLQSKIDSLHRRQSELEDAELEVMEQREAIETRLKALNAEHEQVTVDLQKAEQQRDATWLEIDTDAEASKAARVDQAARLPEDLRALYEKLRASSAGIGAAALHRGRCEGCHLQLNTIELNQIREAPEDDVLRCEECRRILIRTPESGL